MAVLNSTSPSTINFPLILTVLFALFDEFPILILVAVVVLLHILIVVAESPIFNVVTVAVYTFAVVDAVDNVPLSTYVFTALTLGYFVSEMASVVTLVLLLLNNSLKLISLLWVVCCDDS